MKAKKYYLNYNVPPSADKFSAEDHCISFQQFNQFKDSINLDEFNKVYNILTGKTNYVEPS